MASRQVSVLILYRADGRILLQHRTKDAPTFPDYWAFFGGGIENGESPEEAVRREALEELGYSLAGPSFFKTVKISHQGNEHTIHVFVEKFGGGNLTLGEGQAMGWFLPGDVGAMKVNDHDRSIIQAFGDTLKDRLAGQA
jgi:8-oxo-dGTP diphosphatase